MPTEVLHVENKTALDQDLRRAGAMLRHGGLVAFPTETVYGIAVSARLPASVERLYALKGRPRTKPMTVMVAEVGSVLDRASSHCDEPR